MPKNSTKTYCRIRFTISQTMSPFSHSQPRDPCSSQPNHKSQQPSSPAQHACWHLLVLLHYCLSVTEDLNPFAKTPFFLLQMGARRERHKHTTKHLKKLKPMIAMGLFCSEPNPAASETRPSILALTERSLRLT